MKAQIKAWLIIAAVLAVTFLPMLYGNWAVQKGGILDDALLNKNDPYYLMDKKVESFSEQGFKPGDSVAFVIPFKEGISRSVLLRIKSFTDKLKIAFPEFSILSLSTVPNYKDTGEELLNEPFINDEVLKKAEHENHFFEKWKHEVKNNPSVYGSLIGRNFDYAIVNILLPKGTKEIQIFRRVASFLEKRQILWVEWFIKTNINTDQEFNDISVAGWSTAKGLIDAALVADVLFLSAIGLVFVFFAFYFSLFSLRQAMISVIIIVICFFWTRGTIGLMQSLGIEVYERVYILLVYTSIIVSGISFAARKFESYNEVRSQNVGIESYKVWKLTSPVNEIILATGFISILNFVTLYQIGVRGIMEVGIFSAVGIAFLIVLVLWLLPSLHILIGGEVTEKGIKRNAIGQFWNKILDKIAGACFKIVYGSGKAINRRAILAIFLVIVPMILATTLISFDYISAVKNDFKFLEVKTKPLEYIPNTIVYKASEILNKPGNYGFDRISIAVLPKDKEVNLYNPSFITRVSEFVKKIKKIDRAREVNSVIDMLRIISLETYGSELPETEQEVYDSLEMIESDMGSLFKEQFWFENGLAVFASISSIDSNSMGEFVESIKKLSHDFPDLDIIPFGVYVIYPRTDKFIREGKPLNLASSMWIVIAICAFWIILRNRRNVNSFRLLGWRTGFVISAPFIFASSIIALVMIVFRVPLDQATACITALAVNAAIDFSLYLVADYQTALIKGKGLEGAIKSALAEKGKVILIDIALNALCFMPLLASSFIPVSRLGWVMVVMLFACGFGALIITPMLLPWCVRKH